MPKQRRDSRRMAALDRGSALQIALQRREKIRQALTTAKANGFAVGRLRADLRAIEAEVRAIQGIDLNKGDQPCHS